MERERGGKMSMIFHLRNKLFFFLVSKEIFHGKIKLEFAFHLKISWKQEKIVNIEKFCFLFTCTRCSKNFPNIQHVCS